MCGGLHLETPKPPIWTSLVCKQEPLKIPEIFWGAVTFRFLEQSQALGVSGNRFIASLPASWLP